MHQNDTDIKEWHFHVYWYANNKKSTQEARDLQAKLIEAVGKREFICVLPGIDQSTLPTLNASISKIPKFNMNPIGPHLSGSFETWVSRLDMQEYYRY